jgi:hypothetical protein
LVAEDRNLRAGLSSVFRSGKKLEMKLVILRRAVIIEEVRAFQSE